MSRPSEWGNPLTGLNAAFYFKVWLVAALNGEPITLAEVIHDAASAGSRDLKLAKGYTLDMTAAAMAENVPELRDKDLCCWCGLNWNCHGDVLLELANR